MCRGHWSAVRPRAVALGPAAPAPNRRGLRPRLRGPGGTPVKNEDPLQADPCPCRRAAARPAALSRASEQPRTDRQCAPNPNPRFRDRKIAGSAAPASGVGDRASPAGGVQRAGRGSDALGRSGAAQKLMRERQALVDALETHDKIKQELDDLTGLIEMGEAEGDEEVVAEAENRAIAGQGRRRAGAGGASGWRGRCQRHLHRDQCRRGRHRKL